MPRLFSYGDLRRETVQLSILGRLLQGREDEVVGYEPCVVGIQDSLLLAATSDTHHHNLRFVGNDASRVAGIAFEVTDADLARVDEFEARYSYRRVVAKLASGGDAWVYVHAPD